MLLTVALENCYWVSLDLDHNEVFAVVTPFP